jgi:hypothetical protein
MVAPDEDVDGISRRFLYHYDSRQKNKRGKRKGSEGSEANLGRRSK